MRVLVCGGRNFGYKPETNYRERDKGILNKAIDVVKEYNPTVIIEGNAKGGDEVGKLTAEVLNIKLETYPPYWKQYGKAAGYIRNKQMLDEGKPDLVVAFPGGRGTDNMVHQAQKAGVEVIDLRGVREYDI